MFSHGKPFSGFSVDDIARAKAFYGETLGLELSDSDMGTFDIHLDTGTHVLVYPKDNHEPATFTILNFPVPDVEAAVDALTAAGIRFEHYDIPDNAMDAKGIVRGRVRRSPGSRTPQAMSSRSSSSRRPLAAPATIRGGSV